MPLRTRRFTVFGCRARKPFQSAVPVPAMQAPFCIALVCGRAGGAVMCRIRSLIAHRQSSAPMGAFSKLLLKRPAPPQAPSVLQDALYMCQWAAHEREPSSSLHAPSMARHFFSR